MQKFKVYEYPLKDSNGKTYYGSYTIKAECNPCGFKGERLVAKFEAETK